MKQLIILGFLLMSFMVTSSCSEEKDSPVNPSGQILMTINEDGCLSETVPGMGGKLTVNFETNCNWWIWQDGDSEISSTSGQSGKNTIIISFPENPSTVSTRKYRYTIYDQRTDDYIMDFSILQDIKGYMEVSETMLKMPQIESFEEVTVKTNEEIEITIPDSAKDWLSFTTVQSNDNYKLRFYATTNESLNDREAIVEIISLGSNIMNQLKIFQKGGELFVISLIDSSGSTISPSTLQYTEEGDSETSSSTASPEYEIISYSYNLKPEEFKGNLSISSNVEWDFDLSNSAQDWIKITKTSNEILTTVFSVEIDPQEANELNSREISIICSSSSGKSKTIKIGQSGRGYSLSVRQNESLLQKLQDVPTGYIVTHLYIYGGKIDCTAPRTITSVYVSDVENIREYFCDNCENLRQITLSNVKRIGAYAFRNIGTASYTIPATVEYIGDYAFCDNSSYPYVTCYNPTPPTLGKYVFHRGTGNGHLRVPMGSKPKYKASSEWYKQFDWIDEF